MDRPFEARQRLCGKRAGGTDGWSDQIIWWEDWVFWEWSDYLFFFFFFFFFPGVDGLNHALDRWGLVTSSRGNLTEGNLADSGRLPDSPSNLPLLPGRYQCLAC